MSQPFYMSIKGEKQGNISKGAGTQEGHKDEILCQALEHEIRVPRDMSSSTPTGKRIHSPIVITKELDRSSPMLYSALVNNERLTKITIKHYKPDYAGILQNHFTVELDNAVVVSIEASQPSYLDKANEHISYTEKVAFAYQTITWTWLDGGVMAMDDWSATG